MPAPFHSKHPASSRPAPQVIASHGLSFQLVMSMRVMAIVLLLAGVFLWGVLGGVQRRAEENGRENFRGLMENAFGDLDALFQSQVDYLDAIATLLPSLSSAYSNEGGAALAQSFLNKSGSNALTLTAPDGEMLYLLKQDPEAPSGSAYTKGYFRIRGDGKPIIAISYYTADHQKISEHQIEYPLNGAAAETYIGATSTRGPYMASPVPVPGRDSLVVGISLAAKNFVVSVASPTELLSHQLESLPISSNGAALLLDEKNRLVAFHMAGKHWKPLNKSQSHLKFLSELGDRVLIEASAALQTLPKDEIRLVTLTGQTYLMAWHATTKAKGAQYRMLLLAPLSDLSQIAEQARRDTWLVTLAILGIFLPLTWWGTGAFAIELQRLVQISQKIARFDFRPEHNPRHSNVREVEALNVAHEQMRSALATRTNALERVFAQR